MKFLKLIRYQNLLMLAFMQLIFRYGYLKYQDVYLFLNDFQYSLLVLSSVLIAGAGYIINDIMDQETDNDNKPKKIIIGKSISESMGYNIYFLMNVTGVGIGFYLANIIQKPTFGGVFIIIVTLLYLYATSFKKMLLIGNIIVALLVGLSILIIGLFDLLPLTYEVNRNEMGKYFSVLMDFAIFAFVINFIREIVKDMEDIYGDTNQGMNTLPIVIGIKKTNKVVFILGIITTVFILLYTNDYFMNSKLYFLVIYMLIFIISPLVFFSIKIWNAISKKDYHFLSNVLKWVMFFGILSLGIITLNMKYRG
ncbi:MAG: geranylgeranylglycerol-phosphate geranylgeranyltransferase [Flavobacterium sp.]|nr:geranylgeranylglycerol-phosphate geranylgeranyltransferase [Flavobacterium sp.]